MKLSEHDAAAKHFFYANVGRILRSHRIWAKIPISRIARDFGLRNQTYMDFEKGYREMDAQLLFMFAEYLAISPRELFHAYDASQAVDPDESREFQ